MFTAYVAGTILFGLSVYFLRRSWAGNLALLLFSLSLCFTSLEGYYRFLYLQSDGMGRLMKNFAARYYRIDSHGLRASHLPP